MEMSVFTEVAYKLHKIYQDKVQHDVRQERIRQLQKWGPQTHPDGTGPDAVLAGRPMSFYATLLKNFNDNKTVGDHDYTWLAILLEEVFEAAEETDLAKLREELIQVQAVAQAWVEDIDKNGDLRGVYAMRDALERAQA